MDDIVVFLAWTVFNSNNFSLVSDEKKQRTGSTGEKKQKHWYLIHSWSDKACQGTVVNRARYYINGRSQAITFTVPVNNILLYYSFWELECKQSHTNCRTRVFSEMGKSFRKILRYKRAFLQFFAKLSHIFFVT